MLKSKLIMQKRIKHAQIEKQIKNKSFKHNQKYLPKLLRQGSSVMHLFSEKTCLFLKALQTLTYLTLATTQTLLAWVSLRKCILWSKPAWIKQLLGGCLQMQKTLSHIKRWKLDLCNYRMVLSRACSLRLITSKWTSAKWKKTRYSWTTSDRLEIPKIKV